ncbi:hypothetical protein LP123_05555 [Moraxella bovis]|uniref:Uncharacterized protein n=1 Tax=Moraxella bovis TaxID=476 RepID=A0AAQ2Q4V1_MORBO|nr:hypothetical protein [Moraxella bovis]UYZ74845.1 hypothetical protein LP093_08690 [Moraxella bovis]UYZ79227.1 hypothetical protein LP115_05175 [Moraxella bovis]UYZ80193.1 hypothetical protein LP113_09060 [Moraxella bovis]UYZ87707.1 hypothetical protein LP094_05180 [Moraxella bovis]UYZ90425.1 hypothetical protein LP114_04960 [Moraxella bovis]
MTLTRFPINKKTLLIGVIALSLTVGGIVLWGSLSGNLSRNQKSAKDSVNTESSADVASMVVAPATASVDSSDSQTHTETTQAVSYVALADATLDVAQKQDIARQIKNLEHTGSTSGGVLTHKFKSATHAKMSYCFGRKQPLAFEMVKIKDALPLGFVLTGRAYEGVLGETGFDGVYRLFEHPSTKARLEITETHIHPDKPLTLIKKLYREDMNGTPLRFEQLIDKKSDVYYHGEFVAGDRYVSMTSRGMNLPEFMTVVDMTLTQAKAVQKRL